MSDRTSSLTTGRKPRGFTLIELLITIIIIGVIVAVALPSFQSAMRKSRRAEAFTALTHIQQAEEKLRSTAPAYSSLLTDPMTASPPGLGLAGTRTPNGYYDLAVVLVGGGTTSYVGSAVGVTGTSQASDAACIALAVRIEGGNVRYGAAATLAGIDWTAANADPARCWAR